MKYAYFQYILFLLAAVAMGHCIKHLVGLGAWESLAFILVKDVVLIILAVYLFRLSRTTEDINLRNLAVRSLLAALMISFIGDYAAILFKS